MIPTDLPQVTDEHRRSAFAAMQVWRITFEAAMRNPAWRRVIECAAERLRTRIYNCERKAGRRAAERSAP